MNTREKRYLFIDGAYLRNQFERFANLWFEGNEEIDYAAIVNLLMVNKCFYYDCLDDMQRSGEAQKDFEERVAIQKGIFNKISRVPRAHVRYGTLKGASNKRRRQKEVDILIAVDMMSHAARKNMDEAILLAGDMDFTPVVESLVDLGLTVTVIADAKTVASELTWAADAFHELTISFYHAFASRPLKQKYPLPEATPNGSPPDGGVLKKGHLGDDMCVLFLADSDHIIYVQSFQGGQSLRVRFNDLEKLELFCEAEYGKLQWD
jgi:uncharacterized LabA/DUF88 family protein